jgi:hypothetical protein
VLFFDDITIGVTDLDVNFSTGIGDFNGSIFVASGGAELKLGELSAVISDSGDACAGSGCLDRYLRT